MAANRAIALFLASPFGQPNCRVSANFCHRLKFHLSVGAWISGTFGPHNKVALSPLVLILGCLGTWLLRRGRSPDFLVKGEHRCF